MVFRQAGRYSETDNKHPLLYYAFINPKVDPYWHSLPVVETCVSRGEAKGMMLIYTSDSFVFDSHHLGYRVWLYSTECLDVSCPSRVYTGILSYRKPGLYDVCGLEPVYFAEGEEVFLPNAGKVRI